MSYYVRRSVLTLIWLVVALLLLMSLISYSANDPSWSHVSTRVDAVSNLAGHGGAWLADILYTFLGATSWWLIVIASYEGWRIWHEDTQPSGVLRTLGYVFLMIATAALTGLVSASWLAQGIVGQVVGQGLSGLLTYWGALVFLLAFVIITLTFTFNLNWQRLLRGAQPSENSEPTQRLRQKLIKPKPTNAPERVDDPVVAKTAATQLPLPLDGQKADVLTDIHHTDASPLDAFLDETGFSEAKEYEWLQDNDATTPFKPVSSAHLANTKLTKKLDAQLQREIITPTKKPVASRQAAQIDDNYVSATTLPFLEKLNVSAPTLADTKLTDTNLVEANNENQSLSNPLSNPVATDHTGNGIDVAANQLTAPEAFPELSNHADAPDASITPVKTGYGQAPIKTGSTTTANYILKQPTITPAFDNDVISDVDAVKTDAHAMPINTSLNIATPVAVADIALPTDDIDYPEINHFDVMASDNNTPDNKAPHNSAPVTTNTDYQEAKRDVLDSPNSVIEAFADEDEPEFVPQQVATAERPVEIDELTIKPPVALDIHNDALFEGKSRAMQTAAYRANLSPLPSMDLLDLPDPDRAPSYTREQLQQLSELLEIKLQEFNVKANVVNAQLGPVVTRFEVELAPGIKASKVTGISRDLARSLSMASVRVVEVIPGKPYIGIEVPNPKRQMVRLIELLQTDTFKDPNGLISMAMGKDIAGRPVITDLAKAPHMLVAGTTGSGKSVLVNSLLLSMLLKYTPEQLRLILIDPKQLELANYGDIPHLLTPVVTDMTEAASALSWCVGEMERRYQLMSLFKVRKLDEFNKKVIESEANGHPLLDPLWRINDSVSQDKPPRLKPLPQIVIIADEFADMMMQVGKQAEELITRLAQKSRAAGIHLILATQRPSVDVITGLIKANIPVRAALRVNSKVDSRTILDAGGAEDMLGHGDMLFLAPGQNEPNRVHGAFISDAEVNRICDAWRERGAPDYIDNMFDNFTLTSSNGGSSEGSSAANGDDDPLYDEVVAFVIETRKVSASSIQRKFSIGYNRAARIVDAMEEAGLVSGMGKSGKRELLI